MKKIIHLCLLGVLILILGRMPVEANEKGTAVYINPLYKNQITEENLTKPDSKVVQASAPTAYYTNEEEAALEARKKLTKYSKTITIGMIDKDSSSEVYYSVMKKAMEHTGNPEEGDSLRWGYAGWYVNYESVNVNGHVYWKYVYTMTYYHSADQEKAVKAAIPQILNTLSLEGKSDYGKTKAVYDYICSHVVYDYDRLEDNNYILKYSAYSAVINNNTVCQGYAVMMYRMLLTANVECRVVTSKGHAWNIVKLGKYYYNMDSTWDAGVTKYSYDFRNMADFSETDHIREAPYNSKEFMDKHKMASKKYVPSKCTTHNWDAGTIEKGALCDNDQTICYKCTTCKEERREHVRFSDVGHQYVMIESEQADCQHDGYGSYRCDKCGKQYSVTFLKVDHKYGADGTCTYCKKMLRVSAPSVSTVENISTGIQLKWKKVQNAPKYRIYRKSGKEGFKKLADTTSTAYVDKNIKSGTLYEYKVRCILTNGKDISNYSGTKKMVRLATMQKPSLSNSKGRKLIVRWKKSAVANGYEIQYSRSKSFSNKKTITITKKTTSSRTITKLTRYKTYYVRVRSYKVVSGKKYYSGWTPVKSVRISK